MAFINNYNFIHIIKEMNYAIHLNETRGIDHTFDDKIDDFVKIINSQMSDDNFCSMLINEHRNDIFDIFTGYVYNPKTKHCFLSEEPDNITELYPIYIRYDMRPNQNFLLAIEGKDDYKTKIYIVINYEENENIKYVLDNGFNSYNHKRKFVKEYGDYKSYQDFLYIKLKHEFLHIRVMYNEKDIDLTNIRRYKSNVILSDFMFNEEYINDNIISNYNTCMFEPYQYIEYKVNSFLYFSNPQEIDARINETAAYLDKLSTEEIKEVMNDKSKTYYQKIIDLIYLCDSSTKISEFYSMINAVDISNHLHNISVDEMNTTINDNISLHNISLLFAAFYLKYYNRYKTKDDLNIEYLNELVLKEKLTEQDIEYLNNFKKYIENLKNEYLYKLNRTIVYWLEKNEI